MTANELATYFSDRNLFPYPNQEVRFVLSREDCPLGQVTRLEMHGSVVPESGGSVVPESGGSVVSFRLAPTRKYRFSLKFEANPVIEAESLDEAERKAYDMIVQRDVVDPDTGAVDESYIEQEPCFLEEVKE